MIDREHDLPISRQAEALGVSRGASLYYKPRLTSAEDLRDHAPPRRTASRLPVCGQPDAARLPEPGGRLDRQAYHVASLMKRIGIAAIYRRPNTSKPAPRPQDLPLLAAQVEDRTG